MWIWEKVIPSEIMNQSTLWLGFKNVSKSLILVATLNEMVIDYSCNWFHNSISYALLEPILYSIPLPFFIQSLIFKKWWRMPTKIIFNLTKMHSYLVLVCCYFSENNFWIYMRHLSLLQVFEIHKLFAKWWCQKVAVIKQEILLPSSCYTKKYKHICELSSWCLAHVIW